MVSFNPEKKNSNLSPSIGLLTRYECFLNKRTFLLGIYAIDNGLDINNTTGSQQSKTKEPAKKQQGLTT